MGMAAAALADVAAALGVPAAAAVLALRAELAAADAAATGRVGARAHLRRRGAWPEAVVPAVAGVATSPANTRVKVTIRVRSFMP
ncbi:hypothetical protein GCM10009795_002200 [Nocardioides hankookensis]